MAGIIDTFRARIGRKENPVARAILNLSGARAQWSPRNAGTYIREGYQANVYVYESIRMIATAAASVPWYLQERRGRRLVEIEEHPLLNIMVRPNPSQAMSQFIENLVGYLLLTGDAFIATVPDGTGRIHELYTLRSDRVAVIPGTVQGMVGGYKYKAGASEEDLAADRVIHMKTWNPDDEWRGQSVLRAVARQVDMGAAALEWNASLLQNGARPSGVLHSEEALNESQKKDLRENFTSKFTGAVNAGKPLITEGKVTWKSMSLSPKEMDWLSTANLSAREIAIACGGPSMPTLLGIPSGDSLTYKTSKEARKAMWEDRIIPILNFIREELNHTLAASFGERLYLDYDKDKVDALNDGQETVWSRVQSADFLSINEKRRALGYEDQPGGDVILVPAGKLPLDQAGLLMTGRPEEKALPAQTRDSTEAREAYFQMFEKARVSWDNVLERHVQSRFNAEMRSVMGALDGVADHEMEDAVTTAIRAGRKEWIRTLAAGYMTIAEAFAEEVYTGLGGEKGVVPRERKAAEDVWMQEIQAWLAGAGAVELSATVDTITTATMKRLHRTISEGLAEGKHSRDIAKEIRSRYEGEFTKARALTIARTEVATASNLGGRAGAKSTGLPLMKSWLATVDGRERSHHGTTMNAHKAIGMDERYQVPSPDGVDELMYPAASNASAANRINCRCVETYSVSQ